MRVSRWLLAAGVFALAAAIAVGAALGSTKRPTAQKAGYKAALISDVHLGHVRNRGFLQRLISAVL